jgi:N-acetylmuramoyl-L-alanine amidase
MDLLNILIILDAGHLLTTPGKRTGTLKNGKVMLEREFNKSVVEKMDRLLRFCGFQTYIAAPNDYNPADPSGSNLDLTQRIQRANTYYVEWKKAHPNGKAFYISIHSNIGGGSGYEVWVHNQAIQSTINMAANIVQSLNKETGFPIRSTNVKGQPAGVRFGYAGDINANYAVNRDTAMPSCLVEHLFMDNPIEAEQLATDSFRNKVAVANCKAICQYYGVPYVEEQSQPHPNNNPQLEINALTAALNQTITERDNYKSQYEQAVSKNNSLIVEMQTVLSKYNA